MQLVKVTKPETGVINYVDLTDGEAWQLAAAATGDRVSYLSHEYTVTDAYDSCITIYDGKRDRLLELDLSVDEVEARQNLTAAA